MKQSEESKAKLMELSKEIVGKKIPYSGSEDNLPISLGTGMVYFPQHEYLVNTGIAAGPDTFVAAQVPVTKLIDTVQEAINSRSRAMAECLNESVDEYKSGWIFAKNNGSADLLVPFAFDVEETGGGFFTNDDVIEDVDSFIASVRKHLHLET